MKTTKVSLTYRDNTDVMHQHTKTVPYPDGIYDLVDLIVDTAIGTVGEILSEIDVTVADVTIAYINSKNKPVRYTQSVPYPDAVYQIQQELFLLAVSEEPAT